MNELNGIKKKIAKVLKKHGVVRAGIFGSYARGEQKKDSDIDILIEVNNRKFSLIDLIALEMKLKKLTKKKIDLLTYKSIHPLIKKIVLNEEIRII